MRKYTTLYIAISMILIGCDNQSDPMSVGTAIPGGYIVTERNSYKSIDDCIEVAGLRLESGNGYRKTENRQDDGTWLSTVEYPEKDAIQTCIKDKNGNIMFTEAKK